MSPKNYSPDGPPQRQISIYRCVWCGCDSPPGEECYFCGHLGLVDRLGPHSAHWSRVSFAEIACKICDRRGPYEMQKEYHCTPEPLRKPYRMVICGGRDYVMTDKDYHRLDALPIRRVISGGATGADKAGEVYALRRNIPVTRYSANWERYGNQAGMKRNREMARVADAVAAFPGGSGTDDMIRQSRIFGLDLYDFSKL